MKIIFAVLLMCCSLPGLAQYFQFSQYNFTPQRINPATVASSDYALLSAVYRNQSTAGGFHLNSTILNVSYPLISKRYGRWSGIGISLMDDRSGQAGIFNMQEAALSYAINLNLGPQQAVSFGAKVLFQRNKMDVDGLYTGSQYIQDRGFDHSLPLEEDFGQLNNQLVTFSMGAHWQKTDKKGVNLAYWDVSFFDFNKPDNAFTDQRSRLNGTLVAAGGMRVFKKNNMSVFPEVLYTHGAATNVVTAGAIVRCDLQPASNVDVPHVDFIGKYAFGRSAIFGFQFHNDKFAVGLSYDFPFLIRNVANTGTVEIGIQLKRLVRKAVKKKEGDEPIKTAQSTTKTGKKLGASVGVKKPVTPVTRPSVDSTKITPAPQPDLSDRLRQKQDSVVARANAGDISHDPLILEKATLYFNFEFNSAALDAGSKDYLDDLAKALMDNPELNIKLEGHTDNVGSSRFNLKLSLERAKTLKAYLLTKGVAPERISVEGKGMSEPLNGNETDDARARNRRVELTVLYDR